MPLPRGMRPGARSHRLPERGATTVFVAISMVALLGLTAFAFDFGRLYMEREELQLGADAAVVAIATDCAQGECDPWYDPQAEADLYADLNARDGAARIQSIDLDVDAQTVTVVTGSEDVDGSEFVEMVFAGVVGFDRTTVGARAGATWGTPGGLPTIPLIFSKCEWQSFFEDGWVEDGGWLHHADAVLNGEVPPKNGYPWDDRAKTIYFHGSQGESCHDSPSGQDLPGGFGWLETNGISCVAVTEVEDWFAADPGSSPSTGCDPQDIDDLRGQVVLLPYFDEAEGTGDGAAYHVYGYGAVYVTGFYFGGQYRGRSLIDGQRPCSGEDRCIEGYAIGDWVTRTPGKLGGPDLGLTLIQLTE